VAVPTTKQIDEYLVLLNRSKHTTTALSTPRHRIRLINNPRGLSEGFIQVPAKAQFRANSTGHL